MKTILFPLFVLLIGFVNSQTNLTKNQDSICYTTDDKLITLCVASNSNKDATFKWINVDSPDFILNKDSLIVENIKLIKGNHIFKCITTVGGNSDTSTFKLYVKPVFNLSTFSDETKCSGSMFDIGLKDIPPSVTKYTWTTGNPNDLTGDTEVKDPRSSVSGILINNTKENKTIILSITAITNGCKGKPALLNMTVLPAITENSSGSDSSVCYNTAITLTGGNTTGGPDPTYTYLWESSTNNSTWSTAVGISNLKNYSTTQLIENTYFRRTVNSGACSNVAPSVLVTVNPLIVGNTSGSATSICYNSTTTLTGGTLTGGAGKGSYTFKWESSKDNKTWNNAEGISNLENYTTTQLKENTYFRRTVNSGACTNVAPSVLLTVTPLIVGNSSGNLSSICFGDSIILTGGNLTGGEGLGSYTYNWESRTNNSTWSNAAGIFNKADYKTKPLSENTFFRRTVNSGACKDIAPSILVTVTPLITGNSNGLDTSICMGSPLTLKVGDASGGDGNYVYKWESSLNKSTWIPATGVFNKSDYKINSLIENTYYRRTVYSGACTDVGKRIFQVNLNPKVDLGMDKIICKGDSITLSTKFENDINYLWSNNGNKNYSVVKDSGVYVLSVKNIKTNCINSDSIHLTVSDPKSKITGNRSFSFCQGESVILSVPLDLKSSYKWFRNQTAIPGALSYENEVYSSGIYKIRIIDSINCVGLDSVKVIANPLPNIPIIFGNSELCSNSVNQQYTTNPTSNKLVWNVKGADIYSGQSTDKLFINVHSKDSIKIDLTEQDLNTGCSSSNSIIVRINSKYISPSPVPVVPMGSNNDFLAAPKVVDVIRWGKINKTNNEVTYFSSKNIYMDFTKIDTLTYFYFVDHGISDVCFTRSYYIYPEIVAGLENLNEISVNIFPNPAHSVLTIESDDLNTKELIIQNMEGKIILENKFNKSIVLDVQELNTGLYFLKIKSNNKVVNYKFSKI